MASRTLSRGSADPYVQCPRAYPLDNRLICHTRPHEKESPLLLSLCISQIRRAPGQCLRYCYEPGARPLWLSQKGAPDVSAVPDCEHCGAKRRACLCVSLWGHTALSRQKRCFSRPAEPTFPLFCPPFSVFEFQVMPQLLNHLGLDAEDPAALDFGTIAVYRRAEEVSLPRPPLTALLAPPALLFAASCARR